MTLYLKCSQWHYLNLIQFKLDNRDSRPLNQMNFLNGNMNIYTDLNSILQFRIQYKVKFNILCTHLVLFSFPYHI
jgi:hypothetical protein